MDSIGASGCSAVALGLLRAERNPSPPMKEAERTRLLRLRFGDGFVLETGFKLLSAFGVSLDLQIGRLEMGKDRDRDRAGDIAELWSFSFLYFYCRR